MHWLHPPCPPGQSFFLKIQIWSVPVNELGCGPASEGPSSVGSPSPSWCKEAVLSGRHVVWDRLLTVSMADRNAVTFYRGLSWLIGRFHFSKAAHDRYIHVAYRLWARIFSLCAPPPLSAVISPIDQCISNWFRKKRHWKNCITHWTDEKYMHVCLCWLNFKRK
jgi:hypothetical protein